MDEDSLDELAERSPAQRGQHLSPDAGPSNSGLESGSDGDSEDDSGSEDEVAPEGRSDSEDEDDEGALESGDAFHSDDDSESCPICLNPFRDQALGTPESCTHYFCLDCILEWAKNANSCPVDRTLFQHICIRAQFGGKVLKKVPVQSSAAAEDEDPTFCEVCGRSDREDRLLLCDGCDAGYHMECLDPPLQEVPVDEWFCPECEGPEAAAAADSGSGSEDLSLLLADVVPTSSRLRPRLGRTRAIARTRQSERVRATVNRNRLSTARSSPHVPRHLMSLLDETINAVAMGLSTAVYQRPLTPRMPTRRRKRKPGRRKKAHTKAAGRKTKKRQGRGKKKKHGVRRSKNEVTARCRIARALGLRRPARGTCIPAVHKPAGPSLGLMRADIGAAPLSLFGDPCELDPFDSSAEDPSPRSASPQSTKRTVLSRSALRSHQPVARPLAMGISRRSMAAMAPEPEVAAPVPDLLGSILSSQSLLMLSSADVLIHRDGSLSAKRPAPASFPSVPTEPSRPEGNYGSGELPGRGSGPHNRPLPVSPPALPAPTCLPTVKPNLSGPPCAPQSPLMASGSKPSLKPSEGRRPGGHNRAQGQVPTAVPRNTDLSLLPRIPKIKRAEDAPVAPAPARGQQVELPSSCISRLTGREGPGQPGSGRRAEGEPGGRGPQEPGSSQAPAPQAPYRGKSSTFQSFRINIPGNAAHMGRTSSPGFCNTFRPVDSQVPRKDTPAPLFSIRKAKQLKSEIYDPFEPTGSDSTTPESSPERLSPGLLPSEITRTISVGSPQAPAMRQTVRCVTSYTVQSDFGPSPPSPVSPGPAAPAPWDDDGPTRSSFFGCEERTVTVAEPDPPPITHRIVELHAPSRSRSPSPSGSRSRSRSSSHGKKPAKKQQAGPREPRRARSGSGDKSSRSPSPAPDEEPSRKHRARARSRRSSSERSSSHERERARRRKAKARSKEKKRSSGTHSRRRAHSGSPGSPAHGSRRKRARARGGSPPSSLDRGRRHRHPRDRSRERPRERPSSRDRRKRRSRSPSPEHRSREHRRTRSHEKRPRTRSPERKPTASPEPPAQEEPVSGGEPPTAPAAWPEPAAVLEEPPSAADGPPPQDPAVPEVAAACPADDLDYGDTVEAGHVFEDFSNEAVFLQLDDMSSPPSPESSDSSPERPFLPPRPAGSLPPPQQDATQPPVAPGAPGTAPEEPTATPALRGRALVKRVTWNLQEAGDRDPRTPLPQFQKPPQEGVWGTGQGPALVPQHPPFLEPPPAGPVVLEPSLPAASPAQVYTPSLPPSGLPAALPSQPMVQFILRSSLPPAAGAVAPGPALVPAVGSEPASLGATNNSEDKGAVPPRPAAEKATKNEEYLKKLHTQERAVEEVKLAIKPFYQRREVTKDEYKDILRKAVQKICHSKSREINPVKVAQLVKAYVDKYRHMRKYRRPEAGDEPPPATGAQG
ncbi:PHD and RING finger domain-containing protein 1 [Suncus etruscus]|uniref:PHD and RING finger domain-containing protein 1 n=1 Tax=Suncus etruscus TaxID=109475 RepID=UPI00210F63AF|nr:PHD and RING finger domain-containing protein 1 [Suncus etruscus]